MGAQTEAVVNALEIEKVASNVPTLFEREGPFYSSIEKRPAEVISNRDMRIPLEIVPNGNFGHFDPEDGDLGLGGAPKFDKAVINTVYLRHAVQWSKKSEWSTEDKRKAVLSSFKHLMATSMNEFRRQIDALSMTAGDGKLATISAVDNGGTSDVYTFGTDGFGARLIRPGQKVNVYLANMSALRHATGANVEISTVDYAAKTCTLAGTTKVTGAAATDVLLVENLSGANPASLLGVKYHHNSASSGTWLALDRATIPVIRANRVDAGSSGLALPFPRLAMNKIGDRIGQDHGYKPVAWMHPCQQQAYEELGMLVSMINKSAKDEALDLYFGDGMQMAGAGIKKSFSWDKTRIDFVVNEVWGRAEMKPAGFYDVEGRKIFELRGASGGVKTSQIMYLMAAFNFFVNNPAACSYIDGLAVPSGY
jgi:hypothetical protein